jgi:hypothetical protein
MEDYAEAVALTVEALDAEGILAVRKSEKVGLPDDRANSECRQNKPPVPQG